MKKYKNKIIATVGILAILIFTYWWGGNSPGLRGWAPVSDQEAFVESTPFVTISPQRQISAPTTMPENVKTTETPLLEAKLSEIPFVEKPDSNIVNLTPLPHDNKEVKHGGTKGGLTAEKKLELAAELVSGSSQVVEKGDADYSQNQGMKIDKKTGKDEYITDPVPAGKPVPVEPQNVVITVKEYACILSVRCDTILKNISWLDTEKVELVPKDGVIFAAKKVAFYEGESVFNVLLREMKKSKIHMEFKNTPIYNSAYIEGIKNLYEFDCGELSGWMYKVNNWFPNYGCSRYQLKDGDVVEWVYTCNLGIDVGGYYSIGE